MPYKEKGRNNRTQGPESQIHPHRREVADQVNDRIGNVQEEEIHHQLQGAHMSFSLGVPETTRVSLHLLYVSPQGMY